MQMDRRTSVKALFALALALQIPSQAFACRIGWDQHLFINPPKPEGLSDAQIIHVEFSTARLLPANWPKSASGADGQTLDYTLIGVGRLLVEGVAEERPFPIYAIVTSCSGFWGMSSDSARPVVDGNYYLVGQFQSNGSSRHFRAGGVRGNSSGKPIYQGWHY